MRLVCVALLCLSAVACNRVDPGSTAPAPAATAVAPAAAPAGPAGVLGELTPEQTAIAPMLTDTCNLESIDGVTVVDANPIDAKSRLVPFGGWLVDNVKNELPAQLFVRIQSTSGDGRMWQFPVAQQLERADVQKQYRGVPALLRSGFAGQMDLTQLAAGKYLLRLAYDRDGELVVCDNGRSVVLK